MRIKKWSSARTKTVANLSKFIFLGGIKNAKIKEKRIEIDEIAQPKVIDFVVRFTFAEMYKAIRRAKRPKEIVRIVFAQ